MFRRQTCPGGKAAAELLLGCGRRAGGTLPAGNSVASARRLPAGARVAAIGCRYCPQATLNDCEGRMSGSSWRARSDAPPNKGARYPPEVLTAGEVAAIIGQCSPKAPTGIRNRALLMLLYRSGLRVSEVFALPAADVNLSEHTVRVLHGKGYKATTRGFHRRAGPLDRHPPPARQWPRPAVLYPGRRPGGPGHLEDLRHDVPSRTGN